MGPFLWVILHALLVDILGSQIQSELEVTGLQVVFTILMMFQSTIRGKFHETGTFGECLLSLFI